MKTTSALLIALALVTLTVAPGYYRARQRERDAKARYVLWCKLNPSQHLTSLEFQQAEKLGLLAFPLPSK
jgi:hypothetical protein